jgi:hypothetical protein
MNKFKNFCKKPLMIISICLMAVFFVAVVILICIPHGKVYVYNYEVEGIKYKYQIVLDDVYEVKHIEYVDGKVYDVGDIDKKTYKYEVFNGDLYLFDGGTSNEKHKIAKIDSVKIVLNENILGEQGDTVLVCKSNKILSRIFLAGLYFGIVVFIVSVTVTCIDRKNKPKEVVKLEEQSKEKTEESLPVEQPKEKTEVEVVETTEK